MDANDFVSSAAGRVVRMPAGYRAFVPAMLPPQIPYDVELAILMSRADAALSELSGLGRHLPNPNLLIAPYSRREAVLSSRIEGTQASLSDLLLDELKTPGTGRRTTGSDDVREVRNYVDAMRHGIDLLRRIPFGIRLVKELHALLMYGVRGQEKTPGEFRRSQNWIGPAGSAPQSAPYVPPPVAEMTALLGDWERFVNKHGEMPDLVQCAVMHEQFESIHPFLDGNGRVGRLLITLFLIARGRLSEPLLYLSAFIDQHRDDYYALLQRVRTHGDWSAWIRFFLTGVTETATQAIRQTDALLELRNRIKQSLRGSPRAALLLDELFANPYVTTARAAAVLHVTTPTASRAIDVLRKHQVLDEMTGRAWGRVFVARAILSRIEEPPPLPLRPAEKRRRGARNVSRSRPDL